MERGSLAQLDAWIAAQPDPKPTRPEALRLLTTEALEVQRSLTELGVNAEGLRGQRLTEFVRLLLECGVATYPETADGAAALRAWIDAQSDRPGRPEAIRRLIEKALKD